MGLRWNGELIKRRVREASVDAVRETTASAAREAAAGWPRDTGESAEHIRAQEPELRGARVVGRWGGELLSPEGKTASSRRRILFVEIGVRGREGHHGLRRAADAHYPGLARRIRSRLR